MIPIGNLDLPAITNMALPLPPPEQPPPNATRMASGPWPFTSPPPLPLPGQATPVDPPRNRSRSPVATTIPIPDLSLDMTAELSNIINASQQRMAEDIVAVRSEQYRAESKAEHAQLRAELASE